MASQELLHQLIELFGKKTALAAYFLAQSEKVSFAEIARIIRAEEIKKYFDRNVSNPVIAKRFHLSIRQVQRLYTQYLFRITRNPRYKKKRHR
jgi:hypothetical protein